MLFAIACCNRDDFKAETVASYAGLAVQAALLTGRATVQILPQTAFVDKSRNAALEIARNNGVDWLLFVDSDVALISDAQNILAGMIEQDRDMLSGLYVDRAFPYRAHVYQFAPYGVQNIADYPSEPFRAQAVGAGFLLISKRVMEAFTPEFCAEWGQPFNFLNYGLPNELREDVAFCWRVQKLGFELWVDPRIALAHVGKMPFTVQHWEHIKQQFRQQEEATGNAIEGWMFPEEILWLRETAKKMPGGIIELGSWKGRSTKELLDSGHPVTAVDHWQGSPDPNDETHQAQPEDIYAEFMANVGHYPNLTVLKMTSLEAAGKLNGDQADMVFIDASHDYQNVKADIAAWLPKTRKMICGHDYAAGWPGVRRAVDEAFPEGIKVVGSIWFKELEAA
jgi:hypothetical protein